MKVFPLRCTNDEWWSVRVSSILGVLDICQMVLKEVGVHGGYHCFPWRSLGAVSMEVSHCPIDCTWVSYYDFPLPNGFERSQIVPYGKWSWKKSILIHILLHGWSNGLERSWIVPYSESSWNESIHTKFDIPPKWSWKESLFGGNLLLGFGLGLSLSPVGC